MTYKDTTFCASPNCTNECGRKLTNADKEYLCRNSYMPVAMSYYCDKKGERMDSFDVRKAINKEKL